MQPNIGYLHGKEARMELIVCWRSQLCYPRHNHVSVFTLGLVLEGTLTVTTGGAARACLPGEVFLIPPYVPHRIDTQAGYSLLSLCVKKDFAAESTPDGLKREAEQLLSACGPPLAGGCGGLLELMDCLPALARALPAEGDAPLERVRRRLELHPEDKLSLDELAASAFASKYEFIRAFKREVGLTPHQFQLQNRVRKAQRLLARTDSVAQAALDAGFFDQSHLAKQFKRVVGLTPVDYRTACGTLPPGCGLTPGRG